ncbi:MAG TPA: sigma-70 family RNA polymerase sigma factor [Kofleriaceae bacterium]
MANSDHEHRRALEALYVQHERGLYNVAYRYTWSSEDARDVVHDAFVRMWRKRESIDWPRAAGLAYRTVLGLASNRRRAFAIRRLFGAREASEPSGHASGADELLAAARTDAEVRRGIDRLPESLRSVLVMCAFSELDYAAIGEVLGIPAGTVGSRRTTAIARIREDLDHG